MDRAAPATALGRAGLGYFYDANRTLLALQDSLRSPTMESLGRIASEHQETLGRMWAPRVHAFERIDRQNSELIERVGSTACELAASMHVWGESMSFPTTQMVGSLPGLSDLSSQIEAFSVDIPTVPSPEMAFSLSLAEEMRVKLDRIIPGPRAFRPAVLAESELGVSLDRFVAEAAESLDAELAHATSEPDRLRAFVAWWMRLPPWAQITLAVLLAYLTVGISTQLLSEKGMIPSLPDPPAGN